MALTIEQLAVAMRVASYDSMGMVSLPQDIRESVTRLKAVADTEIAAYAPTAPDAMKDESTVLVTSYLYDRPNFAGYGMANAFINSGAAALLSRWHEERAGVLTTEDDDD